MSGMRVGTGSQAETSGRANGGPGEFAEEHTGLAQGHLARVGHTAHIFGDARSTIFCNSAPHDAFRAVTVCTDAGLVQAKAAQQLWSRCGSSWA